MYTYTPIRFYRAPYSSYRPVYYRPVIFNRGPADIKQSLDVSVIATGGSNVNVNINQVIGGINRPVPRLF